MNITPRIRFRTTRKHFFRNSPAITLLAILTFALVLALLSGCMAAKQEPKKLKDVDYTILEDRDIPEKLMETIEQKKEAEFKLSFETDQDLYLVHGYLSLIHI